MKEREKNPCIYGGREVEGLMKRIPGKGNKKIRERAWLV